MTTDLPDPLHADFVGQRSRVFRLALWTGFVTLLTLGFYRFWAKTRLRRWYWSAVRPGGQPLEYTGDGAEKIAGFFLAVSVLAFWLGVVNLLLMVVSLSIWAVPFVTYILSTLGLVPIYFFARYRARSYTLARTRWRGIRFGMAPGAWGYAMRAVWHWVVTLITLGILWPRTTFWLEKFKADRTYFGTARFHQGGSWPMLMQPFAQVLVPGYLSIAVILLAQYQVPRAAWLLCPFGPWLIYGLFHYRVSALRLLAAHKTVGGVALRLDADPVVVARIGVLGGLSLVIALIAPLLMLALAAFFLDELGGLAALNFAQLTVAQGITLAALVVTYFLFFLLWGALRHSFVRMPIWRHYASRITLHNGGALADIHQRDRAKEAEAEGFAEALDLGAAI